MARAGRRPGNPDTRAAIVAAAQREFADKGFDKTSLRAVARAADVDPALIHHYFASKDDLLLAAMAIPVDPRRIIPAIARAGRGGVGVRIVTQVLSIWDDPALQPQLVGLLKAAVSSEQAADLFRSGLTRIVIRPLAGTIDDVNTAEAMLRAERAATQMIGLIVARYVFRLDPIARQSVRDIAAWAGPTIQAYLDGRADGGS